MFAIAFVSSHSHLLGVIWYLISSCAKISLKSPDSSTLVIRSMNICFPSLILLIIRLILALRFFYSPALIFVRDHKASITISTISHFHQKSPAYLADFPTTMQKQPPFHSKLLLLIIWLDEFSRKSYHHKNWNIKKEALQTPWTDR